MNNSTNRTFIMRNNFAFINFSPHIVCFLPYICISEEEKIHAKKKGLPEIWQTLKLKEYPKSGCRHLRCLHPDFGLFQVLIVTIGEHVMVLRGPGVGCQRFEAGKKVNAPLTQLTAIKGIPLVQRVSRATD